MLVSVFLSARCCLGLALGFWTSGPLLVLGLPFLSGFLSFCLSGLCLSSLAGRATLPVSRCPLAGVACPCVRSLLQWQDAKRGRGSESSAEEAAATRAAAPPAVAVR